MVSIRMHFNIMVDLVSLLYCITTPSLLKKKHLFSPGLQEEQHSCVGMLTRLVSLEDSHFERLSVWCNNSQILKHYFTYVCFWWKWKECEVRQGKQLSWYFNLSISEVSNNCITFFNGLWVIISRYLNIQIISCAIFHRLNPVFMCRGNSRMFDSLSTRS